MSFIPFAGPRIATPVGRRRSPAINQGQVLRTLALCLSLACAALLVQHSQHGPTVSLDTTPVAALVHAR